MKPYDDDTTYNTSDIIVRFKQFNNMLLISLYEYNRQVIYYLLTNRNINLNRNINKLITVVIQLQISR